MAHWLVWVDGDSRDNAQKFFAYDACGAATAWAAYSDYHTLEFMIAGKGQAARVVVVKEEDPDGPSWRIEVTGQSEPVYQARLMGGAAPEPSKAPGGTP